jgi:hypothetical protein
MSRAPAPMKLDTPAATTDPSMYMNPYGMPTCAVPGALNAQSMMPGGMTGSPLHTMQSMYGNMHGGNHLNNMHGGNTNMQMNQQMLDPKCVNNYGMNTASMAQNTQNVAVVDFKTDVMAQHQMAQLQQHHQNQMDSMRTAASPSLGLIGSDGHYTAATAATAWQPSAYDPPMYNNKCNSQLRRNIPHTNSMYRGSPHGGGGNGGASRRSEFMSSRALPSSADIYHNNTASRSGMDNHTRMSTSERSISDMIDEKLRVSNMASSVKTPTESTMTSTRAIKDLIDERIRRNREPALSAPAALVATPTAPASVAAAAPLANTTTPVPTPNPTTGSGFHSKPIHEQRQIVGDAVRSVMKGYDVTPKTAQNVASSFSSMRQRPLSSNMQQQHDAYQQY